MIEEEALFEATDYFQPFPELENVFSTNVEKHSEYFLPLAMVKLSHINPGWEGFLPIVTSIEPEVGQLGEGREKHHSYLTRQNWIGFHVRDGKVEYAGDWKMFERDEHEDYYKAVHKGYQRAKAYHEEHECLRPYRGGDDPYLTRMVCMGYLGGAAGRGNWVGYSNFPTEQTGEYSDKDGKKWDIMSPMTEDGRPFEFIGYFPLFAFIHGDGPAKWALGCYFQVFYDSQEKIMVGTFDWT